MIAELHGKISSRGSNLSDRLEDKLTGDIFGTLRYLPFQLGMAQILKAAGIESLTNSVERSDISFWADRIRFWPHHELGEMDAFLELDDTVIGIEVKYLSGLSSDDEVDNSAVNDEYLMTESCHQLARESRIVKEWATENRKPFLLFIARSSSCAPICDNAKKRQLIKEGVELGYVSWEDILGQLSMIHSDDLFQDQMLHDLTQLLKRKGFDSFNGFDPKDDPVVDQRAYFSFETIKTTFSFENSENIDGDVYYEYR